MCPEPKSTAAPVLSVANISKSHSSIQGSKVTHSSRTASETRAILFCYVNHADAPRANSAP
jgi:hypothetical protein